MNRPAPVTLDQFRAACDYPGQIDDRAVETALTRYCDALDVKRKIARIGREWWREDGLMGMVMEVAGGIPPALDARAALDALDARDARDASAARAALDALDASDARAALDARDASAARAALDASDDAGAGALMRFGQWCMFRAGGYWTWDLAWLSSHYFGARQLGKGGVLAWSEPVVQAFIAGVWFLVWTRETLYWAAKPTVTVKVDGVGARRLHCEDGPAVRNDIENLYFLNGMLVPADVVLTPHLLTVMDIDAEQNNDIQAMMIDRFGWVRYLEESKAEAIDQRTHPREQTPEVLYRAKTGRHRLVVIDPATGKRLALGVPREVVTCADAQNWITHGADARAMFRS